MSKHKQRLIWDAIRRRPRGSHLDQAWYDAHRDRMPNGRSALPTDKSMVMQATNEYFCAGAVWERRDGQWSCTQTAPILNWMKGLNPLDAKFELLKRGCTWQFLPEESSNNLRRKLESRRQNVGQSKSSPLSEGAKARFQTNIRHTNSASEGSSGEETRWSGTAPSFPDSTAALSLQTGCNNRPSGCCCQEVDRHGASSPAI